MNKIIVSPEEFRTVIEKLSAYLKVDKKGNLVFTTVYGEEVFFHIPYKGTGAPGETTEPITHKIVNNEIVNI